MKRWAGLLIAASCVPAPAVLEAPPFGDAKTAVYTIETEGEAPVAIAVDLEKPFRPLPELAHLDGKSITMHAMHYACPADVVGVKPGVLGALAEGAGHPLPPAQEQEMSTFDGSSQSAWAPSLDRPPMRVDRKIECAHYRIDRVIVEGTNTYTSTESFTYPQIGVVTGPTSVTIGLSDGRFYRVDASGSSELLDLPQSTPHDSAYVAPDGEVWLYSAAGALVHGNFDRGFEAGPRNTEARGQYRGWIAGPRDASAPFELFSLDDGGIFAHFDGTTWKKLAHFNDEHMFNDELFFGGVAWVAPGEAVAITDLAYDAVRVRDAGSAHPQILVEELFSHTDTTPSLRAIKQIPAMGTIIGSSRGRLFVNAGSMWTPLLDSPLVGRGFSQFPAVMGMAPLDEGVLFGGGNGGYSQYQPELEGSSTKYCNYRENPPVDGVMDERFGGWHVGIVLELGCGYVLLTKQGSYSADVEVDFLTRIAAP